MAPSPEEPAGGAPLRENQIAAFVIGLVLGLGIGGTLLTLLCFGAVSIATSLLFPKVPGNGWLTFFTAVPALALGWWAVVLSRKAINFFSGAVIGLAAGLLGGTALCGILISGFGSV